MMSRLSGTWARFRMSIVMSCAMPSRRSTSASHRAAAISLPGGLVVLMRRYCDSRTVASSPSAFQSASPGAVMRATRAGVSITGSDDGPASGGMGRRVAQPTSSSSTVILHQPSRTFTIFHHPCLESERLAMRELAISAWWQPGRVPRAKRRHCFFRVHVDVAHEPARLVRADRHQGDIERTVALADGSELGMIARITREIHAPAIGTVAAQRKTAPERVAPVADAAAAEMHRRGCRDAERSDGVLLPPIQLSHPIVAYAAFANKGRKPERHDPGRFWMRPCQAPNCRGVEMVVVVVRLQDDVERWHVFERDPRPDPAPWAGELDRRRPLAPHRIGQNVETIELNEQARVSHPRHCELRLRSAGRDKVGRDAREHRWVGILGSRPRRAMHEHPLEETAEPRHGLIDPGIAKAAAGTVV